MAIAEINIIPLGTKTPGVSRYLVPALNVLKQETKVRYELGSMATIVEGDLDDILEVAKKMHQNTFGDEVKRVVTTIKIDDRTDKTLSTSGKMASLMKELKR